MDEECHGGECSTCDRDEGEAWGKGIEREVIGGDGSYELREPSASYKGILAHKNGGLRLENSYFWDDNS